MHVGIDSFVSQVTDPSTGHVVGAAERMAHLLEEIELREIPAPGPIEQRWTASSESVLSPAAAP